MLSLFKNGPLRRIALVGVDAFFLFASVVCAFVLRFEGNPPATLFPHIIALSLLNYICVIPSLLWHGMYSLNFSFVSLRDLYRLIKAIGIGISSIVLILFFLREWNILSGFPRSVILLNAILALFFLGAARIAKRFAREVHRSASGKRVLIIGAEIAGEQLARHILSSDQWCLLGFLDDRAGKQRTTIHSIPILGYIKDLPHIHAKYSIEEVIIALDHADARSIRQTVDLCRDAHIQSIKMLPSFSEIMHGKVSLSHIRDVSIEDLLARKPVTIDAHSMEKFLKGKRVLVTGAAGSIGSRLCHEILAFQPAQLIGIDQNETGIFDLERSLEAANNGLQKSFSLFIADICDKTRIDRIFQETTPDIVLHAAAYKHVPLMEHHPLEAIKNNIFGTLTIAQSSLRHAVNKFIFISTDKAVHPASIMGATKQVGEMICRALNNSCATQFCSVRFGNVLDSQGNVLKIFEGQIRKGGPVEVTHPEMKRYFMLTSEACRLVLQAGTLSKGGEIFMLDMGNPVTIADMAREMIRLAGYTPDIDIPIIYTAVRPGEKLFEELTTEREIPTLHEKIFIVQTEEYPLEKIIDVYLPKLRETLTTMDIASARTLLKEMIPSFPG